MHDGVWLHEEMQLYDDMIIPLYGTHLIQTFMRVKQKHLSSMHRTIKMKIMVE